MIRRVAVLVAALAVAAGATTSMAGPSTAQEPAPPTMAFVGDSIGTQSQEEVVEEVSRTRAVSHLLVANGATVDWSRRQVVEAVTGGDAPSILVVELGHADTAWGWSVGRHERTLRAFMNAVAPHVDCIRWFDIKPTETRFIEVNRNGAMFNRVLGDVIADYPNARVFHYSDWALHVPGAMWLYDRLHVSPPGERDVGRLVRQAADSCDPALSNGPFWDVPDADADASAIAWLGEQGLVDGYANGTYRERMARLRPVATRGQWATALWRRAGSPQVARPAPWPDVPPARADAVAWVARRGLMTALDGRFRANVALTRGVALRGLWRLAGAPTGAPTTTWTDVPTGLADAAAWAEANDLDLAGTDGRFDSSATLTRGPFAALLAPADRQGPFAPLPPPPDVPAPEVVELTVHGPPVLAPPG